MSDTKKGLLLIMIGLSGITVVLDVLEYVHGHGHGGPHDLPGFELLFGLAAAGLLVGLCKKLLYFLFGRRETYYEERP